MRRYIPLSRGRLEKLYKKPWEHYDTCYYVFDAWRYEIVWAGESLAGAKVEAAVLQQTLLRDIDRADRDSKRRDTRRLRKRLARKRKGSQRRAEKARAMLVMIRRVGLPGELTNRFIVRGSGLDPSGVMDLWNEFRRQRMTEVTRLAFGRVHKVVKAMYDGHIPYVLMRRS